MSGPNTTDRTPAGAAGGPDETQEGHDGSHTRSPLGRSPADSVLLASGGALPASTVPKISTPIPNGATKRPNGTYTLTRGSIHVTILRDGRTNSSKMKNRAKTSYDLDIVGGNYRYSGDKITGFTPPKVTVTIKTVYGPGAKPTDQSLYGRGKTLRDHEGHHGTDYLDYMKSGQPTFGGKNGMTIREFQKATDDYMAAIKAYAKKMGKESEKSTDCTGVKASFCK